MSEIPIQTLLPAIQAEYRRHLKEVGDPDSLQFKMDRDRVEINRRVGIDYIPLLTIEKSRKNFEVKYDSKASGYYDFIRKLANAADKAANGAVIVRAGLR